MGRVLNTNFLNDLKTGVYAPIVEIVSTDDDFTGQTIKNIIGEKGGFPRAIKYEINHDGKTVPLNY
jgi:hypothetical protein